jgi:hypothetical protein
MNDEYKRGYADAMNWKLQNHLEHLPAVSRWQSLNDEEYKEIVDQATDCGVLVLYHLIEKKLREKNTCPPCTHNCNQGRDCPNKK